MFQKYQAQNFGLLPLVYHVRNEVSIDVLSCSEFIDKMLMTKNNFKFAEKKTMLIVFFF